MAVRFPLPLPPSHSLISSLADPLFDKVYRISFEGLDPKEMFADL